jgi:hypothetical protein
MSPYRFCNSSCFECGNRQTGGPFREQHNRYRKHHPLGLHGQGGAHADAGADQHDAADLQALLPLGAADEGALHLLVDLRGLVADELPQLRDLLLRERDAGQLVLLRRRGDRLGSDLHGDGLGNLGGDGTVDVFHGDSFLLAPL